MNTGKIAVPFFLVLFLFLGNIYWDTSTPSDVFFNGIPVFNNNLSFEENRFPVGSAPAAVVVLDFNRDKFLDLAVLNRGDESITVLQGDGYGQFKIHSTVPAGKGAGAYASLEAGDFNEDGWTDLIVPNHDTNYVTILYGQRSGFKQRFNSRIEVDVKPHPHALNVADMNGDGHLDFIIDDHGRASLKLYFGQGDGRFPQNVSIPTGTQPPYLNIVFKDLDDDEVPDVLIPNNETSMVAKGDGTGSFDAPAKLQANGLHSYSIAVGDINGDGFMDVGGGWGGDGTFGVWFGDEEGKYRLDPNAPYAIAPNVRNGFARPLGTKVAAADVNGDGLKDYLVTSYRGRALLLILSGTESLGSVLLEVEGNPSGVATGDFNNNGLIDLVTANKNNDEISVLLQRNDQN